MCPFGGIDLELAFTENLPVSSGQIVSCPCSF